MDAQELRNLQEAYLEVVMSEDWRDDIIEKSGEQPLPYGRMMKKSNELASSKDPKKQKRAAGIYLAANAPKGPKVKVMTKTQKEQIDLYDIILSHLLDEGYADDFESAEVIMVNMSEDWRDDIIEKSGEQPLPYGRMMKKSNELASSKDPKKQKRAAGIYLAANAPKGPKVKVRK